jgi:uncharacterized protein YutE (UPF0331/DUF86 family)
VLDRERVLTKLAELEGYLRELRSVAPGRFEDYHTPEKKRSCERLLQISVEAVIDVCHLFVTGLRLGLPSEENDLFEKLARAGVLTAERAETLKRMKGFRNILVHEYGAVDDEIVFRAATSDLDDFDRFRKEILDALSRFAGQCGP